MSTYNPIASVTLSSLQTFVTFNNIPQTYTDLVLVINGFLGNNDGSVPRFRLNNDSGNNYSLTALTGTGSTAKSSRYINQSSLYIGSNDIGWSTTSGNRSTNMLNIMNYSSSNTFKATLCNTSQPAGSYPGYELEVGTWRNTAPVTSLTVYAGTPGAIDFASTTTFNLYGIANASIDNVAKATGGDTVVTDGTYWYHVFRSSGTFTPTQSLTADYLVVAGGGSGGTRIAGGGGAGGMRCTVTATGGGGSLESALSLTAQAYTVTVGAGGASVTSSAGVGFAGNSGSNSTFATITSTGGGGGGAYSGINAKNGGSGGGSGSNDGASAPGTGTANQGYAGGDSTTNQQGGGGGGAGAVGGAGDSSNGGTGGAGVATSISGTSTTYAGGGGGSSYPSNAGAGGTGGGGAGAIGDNNATAGTANTGGGGGGTRNASDTAGVVSGAGGSGIVIVRYGV